MKRRMGCGEIRQTSPQRFANHGQKSRLKGRLTASGNFTAALIATGTAFRGKP